MVTVILEEIVCVDGTMYEFTKEVELPFVPRVGDVLFEADKPDYQHRVRSVIVNITTGGILVSFTREPTRNELSEDTGITIEDLKNETFRGWEMDEIRFTPRA